MARGRRMGGHRRCRASAAAAEKGKAHVASTVRHVRVTHVVERVAGKNKKEGRRETGERRGTGGETQKKRRIEGEAKRGKGGKGGSKREASARAGDEDDSVDPTRCDVKGQLLETTETSVHRGTNGKAAGQTSKRANGSACESGDGTNSANGGRWTRRARDARRGADYRGKKWRGIGIMRVYDKKAGVGCKGGVGGGASLTRR